ncbi:MAG: phosphoribosylamine--glycine ligase, partial [Halobacteriales archaeon]|nr:phosphoribosylamine--glycine ligase [Halobacteriales archaeon]
PKRVLPPETKSTMPRFGSNAVAAAKEGKEGRDFQEYVKPLVPIPSPAVSAGSPFPSPAAGAPFKPYGASSVAAAPAAAGPPPAAAPPGQVHAQKLPAGALNVLLIGSGAREHAMALAIRRSQRAHLFVVMKHRNPGLAKSATGFKLLDDRDAAGIVAWARAQKVHLAVAGPESTLEAGVTDALRAAGIAVASPSAAAARVETSKTFMRELMARHRLPGSLAFHAFTGLQLALDFLDRHGPGWAVKPVGLTGGKGVQVHGDHFQDVAGAKAYVQSVFASGAGGGAVQFEEVARGEEFTLMAFTDGTTILPMPAVQDHKRLFDGDKGPNTGGMGAYAQADGLLPFLAAEDYSQAATILQGIVDALRAEGTPYVGTIYGQFMLTATGPKVIEVNARFGDPEAMNVLHTLESDYVGILEGMATGTLAGREARFRSAATVVKYVVPKGYGQGSPASGKPVEVDDFNVKRTGGAIYMGAIEQMPYGGLETMASRTLGVLGEGPSVEAANAVCEASLRHVHGKDLYVRHDIGTAELLAKRVAHMHELRGAPTPAVQ